MKKINNKIIVLLLSIVLFSCKNDQKISDDKLKNENTNQNIKKDSTTVQANSKTATLFEFSNEENTEIIKISATEASDDDKLFLVGDKNVLVASKYTKNTNEEKLVLRNTLFSDEFYYINIDKKAVRKKIQNTEYFLFAVMESPKGNGDPEFILNFIMLNIHDLKFFILKYTGEATLRCDECIDGRFIENEILDSNPTIKKELYDFANKSKWVYNPSGKEKDINYYKNYEQKWEQDNTAGKTEPTFPHSIKSTYYTENLFQYTGNYNKDEVIENADFKIVSYFRNNIIGYDKNKKLYFPIMVETCNTGCDKKIEFISKNKILIIPTEISSQIADTVNLNEIDFD
ncbi:hypothetical protein [Flavobacterium piscisymbiosum]|uniref:Lipoprotein n=1 Tax=Flavobacterium piscisymbiosum TaxID=2893753 RepID=A0ABS8MJS5_9FLAO|nr:hypothetical protein [Flavobacterium sp. F-30]MCC9065760.1 hypothetical protein [Flavobacterium sp. F-30]